MMKLRLAYRIASEKARLPHPRSLLAGVDYTAMAAKVAEEASMIKRTNHFTLDNVAKFYAEHPQQLWDMEEDIPNWSPPFSHFFAEWNEPEGKEWNIVGRDPNRNSGLEGQNGLFVMAANVTDENRTNVGAWSSFCDGAMGIESGMDAYSERLAAALALSRWMLICSQWGTANTKPLCGSPLWLALTHFIFVSAEGRHVDTLTGGVGAAGIHALNPDALMSGLHILGLGISFCHCKNVIRHEHEADAGIRWHKRNKVPRIKYYTLDINPMRETLRREGRSEEVGIARALHICRGHFATYSPDHPLFGKYVGTFWRPDHVRGSKEAGEVHKRYRVEGN